jgi:hypothetical protein
MDDFDYLKLLRGAIDAGVIKASLDLKQLEHIDSPISVQADSNRWIYGLMVVIAGAAWFGGVWWAVGAATAGAAAWFVIGRPWHRRRMEQRFHQSALHNLEQWKKLWRMPGVVLTNAATGAECASPAGNWRAFVGAATAEAARSA